MVPSDFLILKHGSRHLHSHHKEFSSKVMVKDVFLQNGGQYNVFEYVSHVQTAQDIFTFCKLFTQAYLC